MMGLYHGANRSFRFQVSRFRFHVGGACSAFTAGGALRAKYIYLLPLNSLSGNGLEYIWLFFGVSLDFVQDLDAIIVLIYGGHHR